jgi:tetratricopeptide (TPR) repeat protein
LPTNTSFSVALAIDAARKQYGLGDFHGAIVTLRGLDPDARNRPEALLIEGACLARTTRREEAVARFERLLAGDPDCHEALTWMAVLRGSQDVDDAIRYAERAIAIRPLDAAGHGTLGNLLLAAGRTNEAVKALTHAVELDPEVAEHTHNLGLAFLADRRHREAIDAFRRAAELAPDRPQSYLALASTYELFGMAGPALDALARGLSFLPNDPALHSAAAKSFAGVRNDEAAESHHRRAVELSPKSRGGYATWLLNQGRFEESRDLFRSMIRDGNDAPFAYYGLVQGRTLSDNVEDRAFVCEMERLLDASPGPRGEMFLHYALGKASEGLGDYKSAMGHYNQANARAKSMFHRARPSEPERFEKEQERARVLDDSIRRLGNAGKSQESPIFIVGMIRSGTTLLDQIVSSHPEVASGGELRFWYEEFGCRAGSDAEISSEELSSLADEYASYARLLARTEGRFTDKMPLNFAYVGPILAAMPNARFLHIRRHPVDVALSIWTTYFGQGPSFAYDKTNIVAALRAYQKQMEHWRQTVPQDRLLELDYENLIADPEPIIRHVVDFCGLPWDDACLHHDQNQRSINTPSRWQARQPIYRTSVERWRRYQPWLNEFAGLQKE